jgi:hypothetical protein
MGLLYLYLLSFSEVKGSVELYLYLVSAPPRYFAV